MERVTTLQRVDALTSLRFVAALAVFLHHYVLADGYRLLGGEWMDDLAHTPMGALMFEGRYGVTLFFVLSGFLLLVRYYESIFKNTSFGVYWLKRFARIMPLYWTLLAIMMVYYFCNDMPLTHWPVFVSLTQGFFSWLKFEGIGTAWSLTVEECFYLLLPLLILPMRWLWPEKSFKWWKFAVVGVFLFGISALLFKLGDELHDARLIEYGGFLSEKSDLRLYTIFGRFIDFVFGMMFGLLYVKTKNTLLNNRWLADSVIILSTIGVMVVCLHIFYNLGQGPSMHNLGRSVGMQWNTVNAFFSALIIYFCCSPVSFVSRALSWRPFVYLGEISFALYLVHFNYISIHLYIYAMEANWGFWTSIIVLYTIITLVSALCYEVIERPAQHLILEKAGLIKKSARRPTVLRLLGMARRTPHARKKDLAREAKFSSGSA
jgi:peptidoglycan/LPS O-acetylase OafA/YrhL